MGKYRQNLPQCDGSIFLTDGGFETCVIFLEGIDLPHFASFDLFKDDRGGEVFRHYIEKYINIAYRDSAGFIIESPTWRASADWGDKMGYTPDSLADINRRIMAVMSDIRERYETSDCPMVVSGCVGPRGDGYNPAEIMTEVEAEAFHAAQIRVLSETDADMITALTLTNIEEAIGITRATKACNMPVAIALTVETDGRLPTGDTLQDAITAIDVATDTGPEYFMINCAHPTHFAHVLDKDENWMGRIRGIRANASKCSHAELDDATELDDGNPVEFGNEYREIRQRHPHINVLGGCCGTDYRHIDHLSQACKAAA